MSIRYQYIIHKQPVLPVPFFGDVCSTNYASANTPALASALKQCPYRESGGHQCEAEAGHEGRHVCTDAIFDFMQRRYKKLQGPVCHTRRYAECVYEDDGEGCW